MFFLTSLRAWKEAYVPSWGRGLLPMASSPSPAATPVVVREPMRASVRRSETPQPRRQISVPWSTPSAVLDKHRNGHISAGHLPKPPVIASPNLMSQQSESNSVRKLKSLFAGAAKSPKLPLPEDRKLCDDTYAASTTAGSSSSHTRFVQSPTLPDASLPPYSSRRPPDPLKARQNSVTVESATPLNAEMVKKRSENSSTSSETLDPIELQLLSQNHQLQSPAPSRLEHAKLNTQLVERLTQPHQGQPNAQTTSHAAAQTFSHSDEEVHSTSQAVTQILPTRSSQSGQSGLVHGLAHSGAQVSSQAASTSISQSSAHSATHNTTHPISQAAPPNLLSHSNGSMPTATHLLPPSDMTTRTTVRTETIPENVASDFRTTPNRKRKPTASDFMLLKVLGKGSYGTVMLVRSSVDNGIYAMKMLRKDNIVRRHQVQHTRTERAVLESIRHPFIVELYFAFQTARKLYFVMEYCPGGELFFHLSRANRFSEGRVRFYAAEIVLALEFLHKLNIVYRDLKPENVLLDAEGHVRLTDFGLSKGGIADNFSTKSLCGTPEYLAPEILNQQGHGKAVDWWSLGALIYEMLTGLPPFYSKDRERLFDNIRGGELRFPSCISPIAKDLLVRLFNRNPDRRLGGGRRDAAEVKEHLFFAGVNWDDVLMKHVTPPFRPQLKSMTDVQNFDKEFVRLPAVNSEAPESTLGEGARDDLFPGFTYDLRDQHNAMV